MTRRSLGVGAAVTAVWLALGVWSVWPASASSYAQLAVQSAQQSSSAAGTTILLVRGAVANRLIAPYATVGLDQSREAAATAAQVLLTAATPDPDSAEVRQQLVPLLVASSDGITAVQAALAADDRERAARAAAGLTATKDQLDQFVSEQQQ